MMMPAGSKNGLAKTWRSSEVLPRKATAPRLVIEAFQRSTRCGGSVLRKLRYSTTRHLQPENASGRGRPLLACDIPSSLQSPLHYRIAAQCVKDAQVGPWHEPVNRVH